MENDFKKDCTEYRGQWVEGEIYLNPFLTLSEKMICGNIQAFSKGGFSASNEYIEAFHGIKPSRTTLILKKLEAYGYISRKLTRIKVRKEGKTKRYGLVTKRKATYDGNKYEILVHIYNEIGKTDYKYKIKFALIRDLSFFKSVTELLKNKDKDLLNQILKKYFKMVLVLNENEMENYFKMVSVLKEEQHIEIVNDCLKLICHCLNILTNSEIDEKNKEISLENSYFSLDQQKFLNATIMVSRNFLNATIMAAYNKAKRIYKRNSFINIKELFKSFCETPSEFGNNMKEIGKELNYKAVIDLYKKNGSNEIYMTTQDDEPVLNQNNVPIFKLDEIVNKARRPIIKKEFQGNKFYPISENNNNPTLQPKNKKINTVPISSYRAKNKIENIDSNKPLNKTDVINNRKEKSRILHEQSSSKYAQKTKTEYQKRNKAFRFVPGLIQTWNESSPNVTKHRKDSNVYKQITKKLESLIDGTFAARYKINEDWLRQNLEIKPLLKKKWEIKELRDVIISASKYSVVGYWPIKKDSWVKNLDTIIYNKNSGKSVFLKAAVDPPEPISETTIKYSIPNDPYIIYVMNFLSDMYQDDNLDEIKLEKEIGSVVKWYVETFGEYDPTLLVPDETSLFITMNFIIKYCNYIDNKLDSRKTYLYAGVDVESDAFKGFITSKQNNESNVLLDLERSKKIFEENKESILMKAKKAQEKYDRDVKAGLYDSKRQPVKEKNISAVI